MVLEMVLSPSISTKLACDLLRADSSRGVPGDGFGWPGSGGGGVLSVGSSFIAVSAWCFLSDYKGEILRKAWKTAS